MVNTGPQINGGGGGTVDDDDGGMATSITEDVEEQEYDSPDHGRFDPSDHLNGGTPSGGGFTSGSSSTDTSDGTDDGLADDADADPTATTNVSRQELLQQEEVQNFLSETGLQASEVQFDVSGIGTGNMQFGITPTETGQRRLAAQEFDRMFSGQTATPEQTRAAGRLGATPSDIERLNQPDVDVSPSDIERAPGGGWQLSDTLVGEFGPSADQQRQEAARQLSDQTGEQIRSTDIIQTDEGYTLNEDAQRRVAAKKIGEQLDTEVSTDDLVRTADGWTLSDEALSKLEAEQQRRLNRQTIAQYGAEQQMRESVTPHVQMVANQEALEARAERERGISETFADVERRAGETLGKRRPSTPFEFAVGLMGTGLTPEEAAAVTFETAERTERTGQDLAQDVETGLIEAGQAVVGEGGFGPRVGSSEKTIGAQLAGVGGDVVEVPFMLAGAAGQAPVTFGMDVQETSVDLSPAEVETRGRGRARTTAPAARDRIQTDTPIAEGGGVTRSTARGLERTAEHFAAEPVAGAALVAPVVIPGVRAGGAALARGRGPVGRAAGRVPRPALERFNLGEGSGYTLGIRRTEGKVADVRPLLTARRGSPGRAVETGQPRVRLTEEPITPELRAGETSALQRHLRETEPSPELAQTIRDIGREPRTGEAARVEGFRETQRQTQFSELQPQELRSTIGEVFESHGVPRNAAREVTRLAREEGASIYGSVAQRAAARRIGEPGVTRIPRDVDIADVASKPEFAQRITEAINQRAGREVVEVRDGTPVSKQTGEKLFDIHEAEAPASGSGSAPSDMVLGISREAPVRTTEGVRTTTLSEQTARKGSGSMFQITREPRQVGEIRSRLTPEHPGRVKDIFDFYSGERANIRQLERTGRTRRAQKARESLEQFIESFGEDVATRARSQYETAGPPRTRLADFSQAQRSTVSRTMATRSPSVSLSRPSRSPSSRPASPSASMSLSRSMASSAATSPSTAASPSAAASPSGFGYDSLSIGGSIASQPSTIGGSLSIGLPSASVPSPSASVPSPSVSGPSVGSADFAASSIVPFDPVSEPDTAPGRPDDDPDDQRDSQERDPEQPPSRDESRLDVGWLVETQLGFAGIEAGSTEQQALEEQAAGMGGFTFELLPTLTEEQAAEFSEVQEFFFSR